jgi:hypothetical protein
VDVEFEQMEEGIAYKRNGTVQLTLVAVTELEWFARLVAAWERYPLDFVIRIFDVLASLPVIAC